MFVTEMTIEFWLDRQPITRTVTNPTVDAIHEAISNLENGESGLVVLDCPAKSDACMFVGNALDGLRTVNATTNGTDFFSLVDASRPADRVLLYLGGQDSDLPTRSRVPLAWALVAAEHFAQTGLRSPELPWESDH